MVKIIGAGRWARAVRQATVAVGLAGAVVLVMRLLVS